MSGELVPYPQLHSKDFYEQDPRSSQLRKLCIRATDVMSACIDNKGKISDIFAVNNQLSELGIETDMHGIDPDDPNQEERPVDFFQNPVLTAEYAAGQVRKLFEVSIDYAAVETTEPDPESKASKKDTNPFDHIKNPQRTLHSIQSIRSLIAYEPSDRLSEFIKTLASRKPVRSALAVLALGTAIGIGGSIWQDKHEAAPRSAVLEKQAGEVAITLANQLQSLPANGEDSSTSGGDTQIPAIGLSSSLFFEASNQDYYVYCDYQNANGKDNLGLGPFNASSYITSVFIEYFPKTHSRSNPQYAFGMTRDTATGPFAGSKLPEGWTIQEDGTPQGPSAITEFEDNNYWNTDFSTNLGFDAVNNGAMTYDANGKIIDQGGYPIVQPLTNQRLARFVADAKTVLGEIEGGSK